MDPIKDAFSKVKEDMESLRIQMLSLNNELTEIKLSLNELLSVRSEQLPEDKNPTDISKKEADIKQLPTESYPYKPQKDQNKDISTGNDGVPTNKPTNQQTNQQIRKDDINRDNSLGDALKILNSLDNVRKEVRLKFKDLTEQEFLVFSTLYEFDEEIGNTDYKTLSKALNLSESSIRDYIGKLIKKQIPVEKIKINNKNIKLSISSDLKKIASLDAILRLREL
ncbi:MAG: helix-turn-helix domain-containing protein [Candidatus Nanoarchaeia archaeon]